LAVLGLTLRLALKPLLEALNRQIRSGTPVIALCRTKKLLQRIAGQ
jgi:hypothetical protein